MFRRCQSALNPPAASIAILAMLLLFIAPAISSHLYHCSSDPVLQASMLMADQHHHKQPCADAEQSTINPSAPQAAVKWRLPDPQMDDGFCGYCQLLIHVSLLSFYFIPVIWLMLVVNFIRRQIKPIQSSVKPEQCRHRCRAPPSQTHA